METNAQKTAMPTIAGIFSIVLGALQLLGFFGTLALRPLMTFANQRGYTLREFFPGILIIAAIVLFVLGVLSIIGGVYTLQRRQWGLSLAGAIAAFLPCNLLGLVPIILVALSKREFDSGSQPIKPI
jgi:L-asparagine transporter-like permease